MKTSWLVMCACLCACGGSGGGDADAGADAMADGSMDAIDAGGPVHVRFDVPVSGVLDWDRVSFPSDLHVGDDGTLDLGAPPTELPVWTRAFDDLNRRDGFCLACGGWFPVEGGFVDPASLPEDRMLGAEAQASDAIVVVEVDPDTTERALLPVRAFWNGRRNFVSWHPMLPLRGGTRYAAVLTTDVLAEDGTPIAADPLFLEVRDAASGSPEAERARELYGDALDEIEAAGIERTRISGLAVFTTDTTGDNLLRLADIAQEAPVPSVTVERVWHRDDGGLDTLFGVPEEARFGCDVPPAEGVEGDTAYRHDSLLAVVIGRLTGPRIVEGASPDPGRMLRDDNNLPIAGDETESIPFMLFVPDVPLGELPVLAFMPGAGGSTDNSALLADTAGNHGVAVISIDPFLHGARSRSGVDAGFRLRDSRMDDSEEGAGEYFLPTGETEGDGLYRHDSITAVGNLMGLLHVTPEDDKGSPAYPIAHWSQMIVDAHTTLRMIRESDVSPLAAAHASLATIGFDADATFISGASLGASIAAGAVVGDEQLAGAVLNVGPNPITRASCGAFDTDPLLLNGFDIAGFATFLNIRGAVGAERCSDPNAILYAWYTEELDPVTFAQHLSADRLRADAPDILIQYAGEDQFVSRAEASVWLSASEIPAFGEYPTTVIEATLPASGNLNGATAVAYEFPPTGDPATDHFMACEGPATQDLHIQIEGFLQSWIDTGSAEVIDP